MRQRIGCGGWHLVELGAPARETDGRSGTRSCYDFPVRRPHERSLRRDLGL